jgi:hypothetical protein
MVADAPGPLAWYGAHAVLYGGDPDAGPPGVIGRRGQSLRVVGGPAHGARISAPADRQSFQWEDPPESEVWDRGCTVYLLTSLLHAPAPGAEGPVCQELVWLAENHDPRAGGAPVPAYPITEETP